mmetsp:Transcript_18910/g.47426  ORF Transcript_18910/g.47426 Transcript_18910/m.47426 type:complete len:248 (+) Transcript_18910:80-823(+)
MRPSSGMAHLSLTVVARCLGGRSSVWRVHRILRFPFSRHGHTAVRNALLERLSASQLKERLAALGVPTAGVTERDDLVRLLERSRSQGGEESFVATHEWQRVPAGAILEPGLEVRFDFAGEGASFARLPAVASTQPSSNVASSAGSADAVAPQAAAKMERKGVTAVPADSIQISEAPIEWGCRVQVRSDVDEVRSSMRRLWEPEMVEFCGKVGVVTHIDDERVTVEFERDDSWVSWIFTASVVARLA